MVLPLAVSQMRTKSIPIILELVLSPSNAGLFSFTSFREVCVPLFFLPLEDNGNIDDVCYMYIY